MPTVDQIRESIEARIIELNTEITSLEAARAALQANAGGSAPGAASTESSPNGRVDAARADAKPRTRTRARARSKPGGAAEGSEVLLAGKLEAMLRDAQDGLSASAIAKRGNARQSQVLELLRELEQAGKAQQVGSGRAAVWRLLTEEEWIARRAAELEQLSKNGPSTPRKRRWRAPESAPVKAR